MRNRNRGCGGLVILTALVIASFGVDIIIENADACSYAAFPTICFAPGDLEGASDAPREPQLLAARIRSINHDDGCGSDSGTCADVVYDSVEFVVRDRVYDDVDQLGMMGLLVRAESDSDAGERFEESLLTEGCDPDLGLQIYAFEGAESDSGSSEVLLKYTIDPPQYSGPGGIDISIAFVDQNGNIGPFSEPVQLERRSVVY